MKTNLRNKFIRHSDALRTAFGRLRSLAGLVSRCGLITLGRQCWRRQLQRPCGPNSSALAYVEGALHGLTFRADITIDDSTAKAELYDSFVADDIPDLLQTVLLQHGSRHRRPIDRAPDPQISTVNRQVRVRSLPRRR
jgi:hypothetical protein